jgi:UDP-3-O-[3-hydroxymyristoyl] glucosamine N-acyltransferase
VNLTLEQISSLVNGKLQGDGTIQITGVAGLEDAQPSDISFLRDAKKLDVIGASKAGGILVGPGMIATMGSSKNLIEVKNPMEAFALLLNKIATEKNKVRWGIHPQACVSPKAKVGEKVWIGPFVVIEDDAQIDDEVVLEAQVYVGARAKIGKGTHIFPQAVIREDVQVGQRCIIHGGAVIGSDGFGFFYANGKHNKIPQIGTVIIEDDVEIGSCCTIDRATLGITKIGRGSKIDNLVQIAHNVVIGPNSILVAQVGIAGSAQLGEGVVLGGQVGVADHVRIGNGAQVAGQSGIKEDVEPGAVLFGTPAQPIQEAFRQLALIRRLPEIFKGLNKSKIKSNQKK